MVTLGPGRIGIIAKARDSATIPRAYYSDLRTGLKGFLTSPLRDGGLLDTLGNSLEQRANDTSVSNSRRQEAQLSLGALEAFQRLGKNRLAGYNFLPAARRQEPLSIGGVTVSVFLDLLVRREKAGRVECGGVLFRLSKADEDETEAANSKRREMGAYAATLAQMQVSSMSNGNMIVSPDLCMSVDVQTGDVQFAKKDFAQRAQRLEAECRFAAAMWDRA